MQALFAAAVVSATAFAAASPEPLPGAADEETIIPSGGMLTLVRISNDLLFVQHRNSKWYRVQLTENCLKFVPRSETLTFTNTGPSSRIDKLTNVHPSGTHIFCQVKSVRRSAAPPQYDSHSRVRID